jgi:hypothetical protein
MDFLRIDTFSFSPNYYNLDAKFTFTHTISIKRHNAQMAFETLPLISANFKATAS